MLFSVMLWMPSWGGMINGLLTLRGAWNKVAADPILKFFVVGITFYGMSTFEGPLLSIKEVNALGHYTDWIIAHVHGGALGWVGFMTFGMLYWLLPRMFQAPLWSKKLANALLDRHHRHPAVHRADLRGRSDPGPDVAGHRRQRQPRLSRFRRDGVGLMPMYWLRVLGGTLYLTGGVLCGFNCLKTWAARPARYEEPVHEAPALARAYAEPAAPPSRLAGVAVVEPPTGWTCGCRAGGTAAGSGGRCGLRCRWSCSVLVASLFEIVPLFLIQSNIPTIATVKPYTPLELMGRDIYLAKGCYNCHSQMIRPILAETKRYGEYSKPGESVYDHPFQWGSRRIGPDLAREGGKQSAYWHLRHFQDPRDITPGSIMPKFAWLLADQDRLRGDPAADARHAHARRALHAAGHRPGRRHGPQTGGRDRRQDRGPAGQTRPGRQAGGGPDRLHRSPGPGSVRPAAGRRRPAGQGCRPAGHGHRRRDGPVGNHLSPEE